MESAKFDRLSRLLRTQGPYHRSVGADGRQGRPHADVHQRRHEPFKDIFLGNAPRKYRVRPIRRSAARFGKHNDLRRWVTTPTTTPCSRCWATGPTATISRRSHRVGLGVAARRLRTACRADIRHRLEGFGGGRRALSTRRPTIIGSVSCPRTTSSAQQAR